MKIGWIALGAMLAAAPAMAEIERVEAQGSVEEAFARLKQAVEGAGATIFAEVDHARGASEAGMELDASKLLIFGNPQLGTPVMQADMLAGLVLPLKMLVYAQDGKTWVAYEEIEEAIDDLDVDDDLEVLGKIGRAQENLASAAAGG